MVGGVEAAPRCRCLLSKVCDALQCSHVAFSHMCVRIHTLAAFFFVWQADCVLCAFNLNFIQMRIKWPRLYKEYAGSVDLNKPGADGVCFHTVAGV